MLLDASRSGPETRVALIRHGHTQHNGGSHEPRLMGVYDVDMSELGLQQVRRLGAALAARGESFARVFTSPLRRALRTAEALAQVGVGPLAIVEDLREIDCGECEGKTLRELETQSSALWQRNLRQDDADFRWPGGESYRDFRARSLAAVGRIAAECAGFRVAVVTHAGVISQIVGSLRGVDAARWEAFRPGNTAVTELSFKGGRVEVIRFDDQSHLAAEALAHAAQR